MKVCRCGAKFSIETARKEPAPADWQATEVWVCAVCNNPKYAVQEVRAVVMGPKNARALLHATSLESGQSICTWAIGSQHDKTRTKVDTVGFYPWPRRNPMSSNAPIVNSLWALLLSKVEVILRPQEGFGDNEIEKQARDQAKYEGRGIAEALAIIMHPFMADADMVVKHAVKKHKDPDHEVPGLGEHLWDPRVNPDGTPRVAVAAPKAAASKPVARPKTTKADTSGKLSPKDIIGIRDALSSGLLDETQLAAMYKVSVETIRSSVSS